MDAVGGFDFEMLGGEEVMGFEDLQWGPGDLDYLGLLDGGFKSS